MNEKELTDIVVKSFEAARAIVDGKFDAIKLNHQAPQDYINMAKNFYNLDFDNDPEFKESYLQEFQSYLVNVYRRDFNDVHDVEVGSLNVLKKMRNGAVIVGLASGTFLATLNAGLGVSVAIGLGLYALKVNAQYKKLKTVFEKENEIETIELSKFEEVLNNNKETIMPLLYSEGNE